MERRVDNTRGDALGDIRAKRGLAGARGEADEVTIVDATLLGVVRVDLEDVLLVPDGPW